MVSPPVSRAAALTTALVVAVAGGSLLAGDVGASVAPRASGSALAAAQSLTSHVQPMHARVRASSPRTTARWSGAVDTRSRAAVNAAYWRSYAPGLEVATGWTGSEPDCTAGTTAPASRAATLRAINFVRSLGGLAPVTLSSTLNERSQLTALMMSANRRLSHQPPASWRCYTRTGAANAARSNLALAYPSLTSAGLVRLYMQELGESNRPVGHRRWLMNPFSTVMGTGATQTANAITVLGPTSTRRPNPGWVAWPTAGYFPEGLEPAGRWSLSAGNRTVSFRYARVRVSRNGQLVKTVKNPVVGGYAQPTMSWEMPDHLAKTGKFKVVVSGIRRSGSSKRYTKSYYVAMFTPAR